MSLQLPIESSNGLDTAPSVVVYGPPGGGKTTEIARAFPDALFVQSAPDVLHARAVQCALSGGKERLNDRVTIDESTVSKLGGLTILAVQTVIQEFVKDSMSAKPTYSGLIFDEWSTLCDRVWEELKKDPWGKFQGKGGKFNVFAAMDFFKQWHREVVAVPRLTRKMIGFVSHHQPPRWDDDENSHTRGQLKTRGGPKMPMGLGDQVAALCADVSIVVELQVIDPSAMTFVGPGSPAPMPRAVRQFCTELSEQWFRKVRGPVDPIEPLTDKQGLLELIRKAGYRV